MGNPRKSLLVRADFNLDRSRGGDRLVFKRWRRVLAEALPRLMGLASRCSRAVVRLHHGEEQGRFSGWLRIPLKRHPGREGLRKIKQKLRDKLESVLLAVGGEVINVGVRRCRLKTVRCLAHPETIPLRLTPNEAVGREAPRDEPHPVLRRPAALPDC